MAEFSSGYNLPPGCFESHIPGNRPEDVAWDRAVESIDDEDILDEHSSNYEGCDFANTTCTVCTKDGCPPDCTTSSDDFVSCQKKIVKVDENNVVVVDSGDPLECPYVKRLVENRMQDELER